jgi:hypothetical protein
MPDISSMHALDELQSPAVVELAERARAFLAQHPWCTKISEGYLAWALTPPVAVFFFRLVPARNDIDTELWVIVGDLPSAYIVCDNAQTWQEALDAYGVEMMKWVDAVRTGGSLAAIIPVNAPPTIEYANLLESRIKFIWEEFVDQAPETYPSEI